MSLMCDFCECSRNCAECTIKWCDEHLYTYPGLRRGNDDESEVSN